MTLITHCLWSQTGPGGVRTSSSNVFWLKADAGTSTIASNTPISFWNDQSGNGINVTQTVSAQQPSFAVNVINGMPAIRFDNVNGASANDKLVGTDSPILDNTSGYSFFTVTRPENIDNNARSIVSKRTTVGIDQSFMLFFFTSNRYYVDIQTNNNRLNTVSTYTANTNNLISAFYNGVASPGTSTVSVYNGETVQNVTPPTTTTNPTYATETSSIVPDNASPILIGTTDASDTRPFGGYIAEVIIYTVTLNSSERIIVNNYLSSKYDIVLSANDKYLGDQLAMGNYDFNVAGLGAESDGSSNTFSASASLGMGITANSGLDNGDYIFVGRSTATNSLNISDVSGLSGTSPARWQRDWYIDVTDGGTSISSTVQFNMVAGGMTGFTPSTASNYKLLQRAATTGSWTEAATANSISGSDITFSSVILTDGYYTIGTMNYSVSPLPIELINFDAIINDNHVDINWTTATELNNAFFIIEKSKDGVNFETLVKVAAAGNSRSIINYTELDFKPYDGISYYRLKQVDFDGTFSYSQIVAVNFSIDNDHITIFPNPTNGDINLDITGLENKKILVVVRDIVGKEFYSKVIISQQNKELMALDVENKLAAGTYIVIATSENKIYSQKIIVK